MRTLILCRHAKSSWKDQGLRDIDRPLNKRGKADAPEMGRRLAARGVAIDLIMTSPARRAWATARHLARELDYPKQEIRRIPGMYAAESKQLLEIVKSVDSSCHGLLLVGHNPEFTDLANLLGATAISNLPTAGMVGFIFDSPSWQYVRPEEGSLLFFDWPKLPVHE